MPLESKTPRNYGDARHDQRVPSRRPAARGRGDTIVLAVGTSAGDPSGSKVSTQRSNWQMRDQVVDQELLRVIHSLVGGNI